MNIEFGIYAWVNKVNGRMLIGQTGSSVGFKKRKKQYLYNLRNDRQGNRYFKAAWNKYGAKNFQFIVLEKLDDDAVLTQYEQWYVDYYRSLPSGVYNFKGPADCPLRGYKFSDEEREQRSKALKGVKKWNKKQREEMSVRMKEWAKTPEGKAFYKNAHNERKTPIIGIDAYTGEKTHYESLAATGRTGFEKWLVWHCLKGRQTTHGGFYWFYENQVPGNILDVIKDNPGNKKQDLAIVAKRTAKLRGRKRTDEQRKRMSEGRKGMKFSVEHRKNLSKSKQKIAQNPEFRAKLSAANDHKKKPIIGTHKDSGNIVEYPSLHDAARDGFNRNGIRKCLKGEQQTSGGYYWRKAEEVNYRTQP